MERFFNLMGRTKYIETPEKLKEYFLSYEKEVKANPFLVKDWVGKDGDQIFREKEKPLTIEGFECWLSENEIIEDLGDYLKNKDDRYSDYAPICSYIKKKTRKDQIEGGMAGIFNPSITQRLNGLTEKTDITTDGKQLQNNAIQVEIIKPNEDTSDTSISN